MANQIDAVKNIEKAIDGLINKLKTTNEQIVDISKNAREVSNVFNSVKTPKGVSDELEKQAKSNELLSALIKEREATERKLISTIAKKVLVQDKATKALSKENEELKILRREQRNQVKAVSDLAGSYTKLSSQTNILIKRYQDLAVRQAKGEQLTAKETRRLERLGQVIEKNQTILKKTDAEVGRFQRNVGNYASSYDGLGNAINQLTREAPAFANSLQTGFLAISNNLPVLTDQIKLLIDRNKELKANGEPTKNVLKSLAASFFSLQTAISLGVTLLTLYGKEIVEFISKTIQGSKSFNALKESQKTYNEAVKEGIKNSVSEISQMQILLRYSSDVTKSTESRNKAVNKLIKNSGGLIKEQDRLNILNGKSLEIENKLTKAILNRAIVQALQNKISEELNKVIENTVKIKENEENQEKTIQELQKQGIIKSKEANEAREEANRKIEQSNELQRKSTQRSIDFIAAQTTSIQKFKDINEKNKENSKLKQENNEIQSKVNELIKETLKLTDDYTLSLDDNTKSLSKNKDEAKLLIESLREISKTPAKPDINLDNELIDLKESLDRFNENVLIDIKVKIAKDTIKDGLNDLAGTIEEFTGVSGDKFLDFFDKISAKGEKTFEDLADIAASSFALAGDVSNAFFQGKIDQYEQDIEANNEYYNNLLENENLTDEERGRLELDRRKKEEELRKKQKKEKEKQFELNKAFKIGEIIINTASAVTEALPNIPLSVTMGILGAAQLAVVAAQPVPKFAEGGEMTHDGLMMINDHSSGRLEVVERDGKLLMTDKKNAIVEGKKGDIIHKDAKEYFSKLSNDDLIKNLNNHTMIATLRQQNYLIDKLDNKNLIQQEKINTDRIVKAINSKKTRFNLNQVITIEEDLKKLQRGNTGW